MNDPILFDVDGVANEFVQALLDATAYQLREDGRGAVADQLPAAEAITSYRLGDHLSAEAWATATSILSTSSDFWEGLRPDEHALHAVDYLRSKDREVVFVTSPWDSNPRWGYVRARWLKAHFAAKRDQLVITPRKELVRGARLYEDRAATARAWAAAHGYIYDGDKFLGYDGDAQRGGLGMRKAIVIARPWNADDTPDGIPRLSWPEALDELYSNGRLA
jgi:hypothetical protein